MFTVKIMTSEAAFRDGQLITTETKSGNGNWRTKNVRPVY